MVHICDFHWSKCDDLAWDLKIADIEECYPWSKIGSLDNYNYAGRKVPRLGELCDLRINKVSFGITKLVEVGFLENFIIQIYEEVYFPTLEKPIIERLAKKTHYKCFQPKTMDEEVGRLPLSYLWTLVHPMQSPTMYTAELAPSYLPSRLTYSCFCFFLIWD